MGTGIQWTEETWNPVVGASDYEISSVGRVRSWRNRHGGRLDDPVILSPLRSRSGHLYVLHRDAAGEGVRALGREFGVSHTQIKKIVLGRN